MTVEFEINGQQFTALNGGPVFKFNEAISLQVPCETQEEIDYYWNELSKGGENHSAAGSKTNTASPGRSFRRGSTNGSAIPTPKNRSAR